MKQLELGFVDERRRKPPFSMDGQTEKKLEARMASMIIAVFQKGGIRNDGEHHDGK